MKPRIGLCCGAGAVRHRTMLLGTSNMTRMTKRGAGDLRRHSCRPIWLLIGQRIRARRVERGHPVRHLADELGVSQAVYVRYESGETQLPALLLCQLSKLLDVPIVWFFQDASSLEDSASIDHASPITYRVATLEQRIGALTDFISQARSGRAAASLGHRRCPFPN